MDSSKCSLCRLMYIETFLVREDKGRMTPLIEPSFERAKQDLKAHRDENSPLQLISELAIRKTANGLCKVSNHSFDADDLVDDRIQPYFNIKFTCNPK